jgi:hypothetical protein
MPYIGRPPQTGNYSKIDDISGSFNGVLTSFNIRVDGLAFSPSAEQMIISVGGVIQEPSSAYNVNNSQIIFTEAPDAATDFFGVILGDTLDIGTPSNGSVNTVKLSDGAVTSAKIASKGIYANNIADGTITGVQLANGVLSANSIADGTITSTLIAASTIQANNIGIFATQVVAEAGANNTTIMTPLRTNQHFSNLAASTNDFRLTLTTGTPVTTADVSAAGTIYMTPYKGNSIGCYDGTNWQMVQTTELSVASSTTGSKVFDIFLDYNAGTPQLVTTDWTNDTTRATALTYQDGVLVQTGNTDWRYLGTARTKTASQVDDAEAFRHLWNYYNRVEKDMVVFESTNSWTYSTPTIRQSNANSANQLDFVIGVSEDAISAKCFSSVSNSTLNQTSQTGIGLDSTTTFSSDGQHAYVQQALAGNVLQAVGTYKSIIAEGRHYLSWNEWSGGVTGTWRGDNADINFTNCGIIGSIKC